ncbi:MAG: endonuclease V [Cytophagaceae bacterium]|jgi:exodeoxyribonuclease-5/deoxyribonuclease V|nr:endonuclease V [Cytophagaceae bacterium]
MIAAFDTYYFDNKAKTVCVTFETFNDSAAKNIYAEVLGNVEEYTPGEFYKRELPCIVSLCKQLPIEQLELIVIDGFVYLDDDYALGLGGRLYEALGRKIPVVGVAKSNFTGIQKLKIPIVRGESLRPLFITAIGIELSDAANLIQQMKGSFRIPDLLKTLDRFTKEII